jgi:hypothetical protein
MTPLSLGGVPHDETISSGPRPKLDASSSLDGHDRSLPV